MKKIFTLISMALVAMSANAQTTPDEKYAPVADDGTLATEFQAENLTSVTSPYVQSIATVNGNYITIKLVAGATPADIKDATGQSYGQDLTAGEIIGQGTELNGDGEEVTYDIYSCTVNTWNTPTWSTGNHGDTGFRWVQGSGNPYTGLKAKKTVKDGENVSRPDGTQAYTAIYDYYKTDGSAGLPLTGEYLEFTAKESGMLKIKAWINKGGDRYLYIVDKETGKTLTWDEDKTKTQYKVEGYVNGQKNEDGSMKFFEYMPVNENYLIYPDFSGNVRLVWFVFDLEKDKTYLILGSNWQFGFAGYEFYKGQTIDNYTPSDPATGIDAVKNAKNDNANAPIYNMAGQRVNKSYKGVVIQNGRKFVNK